MPDHTKLAIYPPILQRARDLRHPLTPAESKVWAQVRDRRLGYKIRRQHPIDRFIADFYCNEARLVIEIDGDTHAAPDQTEYDTARTTWLEAHRYTVIRFHNDQVHHNLPAVLEAIHNACTSHSSLLHHEKAILPSPGGRGAGGEGERAAVNGAGVSVTAPPANALLPSPGGRGAGGEGERAAVNGAGVSVTAPPANALLPSPGGRGAGGEGERAL